MRAIIGVLFALLVGAQAAWADTVSELKGGDFTIQVGAREQANLIYQIDCLARLITCTSDVYEPFWRDQLGYGQDDAALVKEWASLRDSIQRFAGSNDPTLPVKASVPILGTREDSSWNKLRWAEFVATDADDLKRVWTSLAPGEAVTRMSAILDHFRPRFAAWWKDHENELTSFIPGIEAAMRKGRGGELLSATAKFYRADLGDHRVFLHLFLQPKTQKPHSKATRLGAHMTIEVVSGERPEDRVDVIVHELVHHVFGSMPPERRAALVDALLRTGSSGVPAWNLFDEVQATVIGNILVGRNVSTPQRFQKLLGTPQSFYADEMIDLGARATQSLFEQALAKGERLKPSFAEAFVAALRSGLGARLDQPALHLRSMVLNVDSDPSPWPAKFRAVVKSWSVWTMDELGSAKVIEKLDRFPGLSAVAFATDDQVAQLDRAAKSFGLSPGALTAALASSRAVVVVSQRTPMAYAFVFVARDTAAMEGVIAAFPSCRLKAGVCARIE